MPPSPSVEARLPARRAIGVLALALALVLAIPQQSSAADPRLEKAQERRAELQETLDAVVAEGERVRADIESLEDDIAAAEEERAELLQTAEAASATAAVRARSSYIRGTQDPMLAVLDAENAAEALEQARLLAVLAGRDRSEFELASAAGRRAQALAEEATQGRERLRTREGELREKRAETDRLLEEAKQAEDEVRALIAKEAAARARERASRGETVGPASVTGGIACPVGQPRSYIDSWGYPRSGGRRHKGVDILAPHGIPIYAYEDGTITRMNTGGLGGISLYLMGDSGNQYYYTHLSGYTNVSVGQRVTAGQHIAFNGDTGNARGTPHLHWEVRPGGGGNVNPYPFALRACG